MARSDTAIPQIALRKLTREVLRLSYEEASVWLAVPFATFEWNRSAYHLCVGCCAAPAEQLLARAAVSESYGGKTILLQTAALAAYRQMTEAARGDNVIPAGSNLLAIFSGFRSPAYDAARCARQHNCQGLVRASCS